MNWNNDTLNKVQAIEDNLFNNKLGSGNNTFTSFIHNTSEWIELAYEKEVLDYKPIEKYVVPKYSAYRFYVINPDELDAIINKVAKFIELGSNLNVACTLAGYSYNVLRPKFTVEHKEKFKQARELKYKNNQ